MDGYEPAILKDTSVFYKIWKRKSGNRKTTEHTKVGNVPCEFEVNQFLKRCSEVLHRKEEAFGNKLSIMQYYFSKVIEKDFDKAIEEVTAALKEEGFGILTEIDVQSSQGI